MKAAPRDASWYEHPNVSSFKVVHADSGDAFAACNSSMMLDVPVWADAAEVPTNMRCKRLACSAAFTEADSTDRPDGGDGVPAFEETKRAADARMTARMTGADRLHGDGALACSGDGDE